MRRLIERGLPELKLTFVDPDDHYVYGARYRDFDALYTHVVSRRSPKIANLPLIENLDVLIDHFLAELPENKKYSVEVKEEEIPAGLKEYVKGGSLIAKLLEYRCLGKKCSVSNEIALERAKRCAGCIYNTKRAPNMGIIEQIGRGIISWLVKGKENTTPYDEQLGQCILCGCVLKDKVFCKSSIVKQYLSPEILRTLPVDKKTAIDGSKMTCWQVDENLMKE